MRFTDLVRDGKIASPKIGQTETSGLALNDIAAAFADPNEIARLVEAASEIGEPNSYDGKRESIRIVDSLQLEVATDITDTKASVAVSMHNVSHSGCAFWTRTEMSIDETIFVREFSGDNSRPWLPARVTHCTVGIRGFMIGVAFNITANAS